MLTTKLLSVVQMSGVVAAVAAYCFVCACVRLASATSDVHPVFWTGDERTPQPLISSISSKAAIARDDISRRLGDHAAGLRRRLSSTQQTSSNDSNEFERRLDSNNANNQTNADNNDDSRNTESGPKVHFDDTATFDTATQKAQTTSDDDEQAINTNSNSNTNSNLNSNSINTNDDSADSQREEIDAKNFFAKNEQQHSPQQLTVSKSSHIKPQTSLSSSFSPRSQFDVSSAVGAFATQAPQLAHSLERPPLPHQQSSFRLPTTTQLPLAIVQQARYLRPTLVQPQVNFYAPEQVQLSTLESPFQPLPSQLSPPPQQLFVQRPPISAFSRRLNARESRKPMLTSNTGANNALINYVLLLDYVRQNANHLNRPSQLLLKSALGSSNSRINALIDATQRTSLTSTSKKFKSVSKQLPRAASSQHLVSARARTFAPQAILLAPASATSDAFASTLYALPQPTNQQSMFVNAHSPLLISNPVSINQKKRSRNRRRIVQSVPSSNSFATFPDTSSSSNAQFSTLSSSSQNYIPVLAIPVAPNTKGDEFMRSVDWQNVAKSNAYQLMAGNRQTRDGKVNGALVGYELPSTSQLILPAVSANHQQHQQQQQLSTMSPLDQNTPTSNLSPRLPSASEELASIAVAPTSPLVGPSELTHPFGHPAAMQVHQQQQQQQQQQQPTFQLVYAQPAGVNERALAVGQAHVQPQFAHMALVNPLLANQQQVPTAAATEMLRALAYPPPLSSATMRLPNTNVVDDASSDINSNNNRNSETLDNYSENVVDDDDASSESTQVASSNKRSVRRNRKRSAGAEFFASAGQLLLSALPLLLAPSLGLMFVASPSVVNARNHMLPTEAPITASGSGATTAATPLLPPTSTLTSTLGSVNPATNNLHGPSLPSAYINSLNSIHNVTSKSGNKLRAQTTNHSTLKPTVNSPSSSSSSSSTTTSTSTTIQPRKKFLFATMAPPSVLPRNKTDPMSTFMVIESDNTNNSGLSSSDGVEELGEISSSPSSVSLNSDYDVQFATVEHNNHRPLQVTAPTSAEIKLDSSSLDSPSQDFGDNSQLNGKNSVSLTVFEGTNNNYNNNNNGNNNNINDSNNLYPVSTWPELRQKTVSVITSKGNKTLPNANTFDSYNSAIIKRRKKISKRNKRQVRNEDLLFTPNLTSKQTERALMNEFLLAQQLTNKNRFNDSNYYIYSNNNNNGTNRYAINDRNVSNLISRGLMTEVAEPELTNNDELRLIKRRRKRVRQKKIKPSIINGEQLLQARRSVSLTDNMMPLNEQLERNDRVPSRKRTQIDATPLVANASSVIGGPENVAVDDTLAALPPPPLPPPPPMSESDAYGPPPDNLSFNQQIGDGHQPTLVANELEERSQYAGQQGYSPGKFRSYDPRYSNSDYQQSTNGFSASNNLHQQPPLRHSQIPSYHRSNHNQHATLNRASVDSHYNYRPQPRLSNTPTNSHYEHYSRPSSYYAPNYMMNRNHQQQQHPHYSQASSSSYHNSRQLFSRQEPNYSGYEYYPASVRSNQRTYSPQPPYVNRTDDHSSPQIEYQPMSSQHYNSEQNYNAPLSATENHPPSQGGNPDSAVFYHAHGYQQPQQQQPSNLQQTERSQYSEPHQPYYAQQNGFRGYDLGININQQQATRPYYSNQPAIDASISRQMPTQLHQPMQQQQQQQQPQAQTRNPQTQQNSIPPSTISQQNRFPLSTYGSNDSIIENSDSGNNQQPQAGESHKRVQFNGADRDRLMASYLTCDGLLNDSDHCLERLSCEFSDPHNIEKANKLDRAVSSILLGHILNNNYIPEIFKVRLREASSFGYTNSGSCSKFVCEKLRTTVGGSNAAVGGGLSSLHSGTSGDSSIGSNSDSATPDSESETSALLSSLVEGD